MEDTTVSTEGTEEEVVATPATTPVVAPEEVTPEATPVEEAAA
jgi:hypothetical protein